MCVCGGGGGGGGLGGELELCSRFIELLVESQIAHLFYLFISYDKNDNKLSTI